jgi:hypothetical protein
MLVRVSQYSALFELFSYWFIMTLHISQVEAREGSGVRPKNGSSSGTHQDHWYKYGVFSSHSEGTKASCPMVKGTVKLARIWRYVMLDILISI